MKLTDFLSDIGRPVAYYPALRRITGSTNATILLCQFVYWRGKESDPEGWLYKESDEIETETGLSYGEQKTARRNLIEAGLLEEHYARLDHQMKFRLLLDTINDKWGNDESHIPESGKPEFGNEQKPLSLNESETTTETTSDIKPTLSFDEESADPAWSMLSGKPITEKALAKQQSRIDFENMIDKQLTRLGLNFSQFVEDDKSRFRKFIAAEREKGRELSAFVDWWLKDEFRRSNTPWKLDPIRQQWLKAFTESKSTEPNRAGMIRSIS